MAAFSVPKSKKIHQKWKSKTHRFLALILASILVRFGLHLGAQVGAKLASFGPQDAPKTHQKGKKRDPNAQDGPRPVPDPSGTPPDLDFGAPEPRFSTDFGSFFGYFWTSIFQSEPSSRRLAQEPPGLLINWRGGTKAQPSTIIVVAVRGRRPGAHP